MSVRINIYHLNCILKIMPTLQDAGSVEKYGATDAWLSTGGHRHWCEIQTFIGNVFTNISYTQLAIISIDRYHWLYI